MKFLDRISSKNTLILICIASALCYGAVAYYIAAIGKISGGKGVLDFEFGYDASTVNSFFSSYGDEGIQLYVKMLTVDIFNPLFYALVMIAFMHIFLKRSKFKKLAFLPIFAALMDYAENLYLFKMATSYPNIMESTIATANTLSIIKMCVLILTIICFSASMIFWLIDRKKLKS